MMADTSQGMTLVPSVTELILAELLYLQYEDNNKPIYLYINSTGTSKVWLEHDVVLLACLSYAFSMPLACL